jgi:hypothetical protein
LVECQVVMVHSIFQVFLVERSGSWDLDWVSRSCWESWLPWTVCMTPDGRSSLVCMRVHNWHVGIKSFGSNFKNSGEKVLRDRIYVLEFLWETHFHKFVVLFQITSKGKTHPKGIIYWDNNISCSGYAHIPHS